MEIHAQITLIIILIVLVTWSIIAFLSHKRPGRDS